MTDDDTARVMMLTARKIMGLSLKITEDAFMSTERTQRTITVWDWCECGSLLHSMAEGVRGTCATCWVKAMPSDTKKALNKMISAAFKPTTEEEKSNLVDSAFEKLDRDRTNE